MKRILYINMCSTGSTGNMTFLLADAMKEEGWDVGVATFLQYGNTKKKQIKPYHKIFGSALSAYTHYYLGRLFGFNGCYSLFSTLRLLHYIEKFDPEIVHLHNLHGYCVNLPILLKHLNKSKRKVFWTLHDCWAITGHCTHFDMIGCSKWQNGCYDCKLLHTYPKSLLDDSKRMWNIKKKLFTSIDTIQIVTPSKWLEEQIKCSYLKKHKIRTINNGIDLEKYHCVNTSFREKYACLNKPIILGVANCWDRKKGLDVFISLSDLFKDKYQIVLVGLDNNQITSIPKSIISVSHTNSLDELLEIYSAADVFVNPTREDTFPTVNIEALACGVPVVTFSTGGSPEIIDKTCGISVAKDSINEMALAIEKVISSRMFSKSDCIARASFFSKSRMIEQYRDLYMEGVISE